MSESIEVQAFWEATYQVPNQAGSDDLGERAIVIACDDLIRAACAVRDRFSNEPGFRLISIRKEYVIETPTEILIVPHIEEK